jgi:hypothetical protein
MTRKPALWYGVLGVMFFILLWQFSTTVFPIRSEWWMPAIVPATLVTAGLGLMVYGWQSAIPGSLPKAGAVLGLSIALLLRLGGPGDTAWLPALGLVPVLAGAGMLTEISRGTGWLYSRRQAASLIVYGCLLSLAFILLIAPGAQSAVSITHLDVFTGWSVFLGTILEIWMFFGSFFERIVR